MDKSKGHTKVQWLVAMIANLTVLSYGLQAGWMSPMTKVLQSPETPTGSPLSDSHIAWIASTLCLAAAISTPVYAYIADAYGRRAALIGIAVPQAISWIIKLMSSNIYGLMLARVFCGIASGGCFNIAPMYTKEISQDEIRGVLGTMVFVFQNIGLMAMYALGSYLEYYTVLWVVVGVPIINALLLWKAPESPAYLMKCGKVEEAISTLSFLRGLDMNDKALQNEVDALKNENAYYKSIPKVTYSTIFKDRGYTKAFFIIFSIITIQACNGNFTILTYASRIMSSSGITVSADLQTLSFPAVMILGSLTSMLCVERFGRKFLFIGGLALTALSIATLASSMLLQANGVATSPWTPLFTIVTSVFAYAAGVSPVPYIVMSEMFNFQIRSKLMGIIVSYAWFVSFIQLLAFPSISAALGIFTTFYGFAAINLLGVFIALVFLPETRGKSIEDIEKDLRGV